MNKKQFIEYGKQGAKVRWASRYALIQEMSKYVHSHEELDVLAKLRTKTIEIIVNRFKKLKHE